MAFGRSNFTDPLEITNNPRFSVDEPKKRRGGDFENNNNYYLESSKYKTFLCSKYSNGVRNQI